MLRAVMTRRALPLLLLVPLAASCDKTTTSGGDAKPKAKAKDAKANDAKANEGQDAKDAKDAKDADAPPSADAGGDAGAVAVGDRPQDKGEAAALGKPAPDFVLSDLGGQAHTLAQYKGKTVILEWFNPECPFVNYAHKDGGPLWRMAAEETTKGVVWLAINSGAAGMQGHDPAINKTKIAEFGIQHPVLLDPDGVVGKLYGAKKTPHMYVIDETGVLQFAGGIDNAPMGEVDGDDPQTNYVAAALADLRAKKAVATAEAKPWGCTVKYAKKG